MSVRSEVKNITKKETATGAIYLALIAAAFADSIPTMADGLYFILEKKLRDAWTKGEITPQAYWRKTALYYYTLNSAYWLLILGITASVRGDASKKLKVAASLVGVGIVFGVIFKNIKKDKYELKNELEEKQKLLIAHPEYAKIFKGSSKIPDFRDVEIEKLKKELLELKNKT